MKKLMTIGFILFIAFLVLTAFQNQEKGNGQLTKESATEWAKGEGKCAADVKITEVEAGYIIECSEEFQGMAGYYANDFILTYAADPAKKFHIDPY